MISLLIRSSTSVNKKDQKEDKEYRKTMNGACFFCYTNRKTSVSYIEEAIIPQLAPNIQIIFLNGREVTNREDSMYISRMLRFVKDRRGFPYLLKIVDEKVLDCSIKYQTYNTKNSNKPTEPLLASINAFYNSSTPSPN